MEAGEGARVRFVTYNVLSTHLASPDHHTHSSPEILSNDYRFEKLAEKLEQEIENNSIIVLQEVSEVWAGKLTVLFTNVEYFSHSRCYGSAFNGYMGVMIAFPLKLYLLKDLESKRITDTIYWPDDERHEIHNKREYQQKTLGSIKKSKGRFNSTIWAMLIDKETKKQFCIGTYHMPCMFWDPTIMDIHASLLLRYLQEKSNSTPLIIGGDFNIQPTSSSYQMITTGKTSSLVESMLNNSKELQRISFAEDQKKKKKSKKGLKKGITKIFKMNSAYKLKNEAEPMFTNHSWTGKKGKKAFAEAIDYIFVSEQFKVLEVRELYSRKSGIGSDSLPNANEPSDHLMLAASLLF